MSSNLPAELKKSSNNEDGATTNSTFAVGEHAAQTHQQSSRIAAFSAEADAAVAAATTGSSSSLLPSSSSSYASLISNPDIESESAIASLLECDILADLAATPGSPLQLNRNVTANSGSVVFNAPSRSSSSPNSASFSDSVNALSSEERSLLNKILVFRRVKAIQDSIRGDSKPIEIIPNQLYLGSIGCAYSLKTLQELGISHIVNCIPGFRAAFPDKFIYLLCPFFDSPSEKLDVHYEKVFAFIDIARGKREKYSFESEEVVVGNATLHASNMQRSNSAPSSSSSSTPSSTPSAVHAISSSSIRPNRILIHCFAGQSRSAALALAYLIAREGYRLNDAMAMLRAKRPQIAPNLNFLRQLKELDANFHHVRTYSPLTAQMMQNSPSTPNTNASNSTAASTNGTARLSDSMPQQMPPSSRCPQGDKDTSEHEFKSTSGADEENEDRKDGRMCD